MLTLTVHVVTPLAPPKGVSLVNVARDSYFFSAATIVAVKIDCTRLAGLSRTLPSQANLRSIGQDFATLEKIMATFCRIAAVPVAEKSILRFALNVTSYSATCLNLLYVFFHVDIDGSLNCLAFVIFNPVFF